MKKKKDEMSVQVEASCPQASLICMSSTYVAGKPIWNWPWQQRGGKLYIRMNDLSSVSAMHLAEAFFSFNVRNMYALVF